MPDARSRKRPLTRSFSRADASLYPGALLGAVPKLGSSLVLDRRTKLTEIRGRVPRLNEKIVGCAFADRCPIATPLCREVEPAVVPKRDGHLVALPLRAGTGPHEREVPRYLRFVISRSIFPAEIRLVRRARAVMSIAVDGVTFAIGRGETLSLVGESGCGKSTVGRGHPAPPRNRRPGKFTSTASASTILPSAKLRLIRRRMQIVFQDPLQQPQIRASGFRDVICRADREFWPGAWRRQRSTTSWRPLLDKVGLPRDAMETIPARILGWGSASASASPVRSPPASDFIICDEAVFGRWMCRSRRRLSNLLSDLQDELGAKPFCSSAMISRLWST